jgi:prolipoprotein diacylglyceryltransferase
MFGIYMILAGVERFFIELIRVNTKYKIGALEFTQAEMISVFLVMGGIIMIAAAKRKPKLLDPKANG